MLILWIDAEANSVQEVGVDAFRVALTTRLRNKFQFRFEEVDTLEFEIHWRPFYVLDPTIVSVLLTRNYRWAKEDWRIALKKMQQMESMMKAGFRSLKVVCFQLERRRQCLEFEEVVLKKEDVGSSWCLATEQCRDNQQRAWNLVDARDERLMDVTTSWTVGDVNDVDALQLCSNSPVNIG